MFAIPGSGEYSLQPIFVEDIAALAIQVAQQSENVVLDAVGPEAYSFNELVHCLKVAVGSRAYMVHVPPHIALGLTRGISPFVKDIILTPDEVRGLLANLLVSSQSPTGTTSFSNWLASHSAGVGQCYASELQRHFK